MATDVIGDLKVGWSLGAMLYEINTLPWKMDNSNPDFFVTTGKENPNPISVVASTMLFVVIALVGLATLATRRRRNEKKHFQPLNADAENYPTYT